VVNRRYRVTSCSALESLFQAFDVTLRDHSTDSIAPTNPQALSNLPNVTIFCSLAAPSSTVAAIVKAR